MMTRWVCVATAVQLYFVPTGLGQSLADVARKERQRREKVEAKNVVVTEKTLREAEGQTMSTMGESTQKTSGEAEPITVSPASKTGPGTPEHAGTNARKDGAELRRSFLSRILEAISAVERAENDVATCNDRDKR